MTLSFLIRGQLLLAVLLMATALNVTHRPATRVDQILAHLGNPNDPYVLVSAHRSDWRNYPENSLEAMQSAIDMGVDIIELDIRMTKDKQLVVIHDETLDRTTTGKGRVSDWTLDSLRTLYLRDGSFAATPYRLPTLEEALAVLKGKALFCADKSIDKIPAVLEVLAKTGMERQAIFFVMPLTYTQARSAFGAKLEAVNYFPTVGTDTKDIPVFIDGFLTSGYKPKAFQFQIPEDRPDLLPYVAQVRKRGVKIAITASWAWQSLGHYDEPSLKDPEAGWGWLVKQGVTVMETNRPAQLLAYLRSRKLHD